MKLHWSPRSPFVRKVMIVAHELGLADRITTPRTVVGMEQINEALLAENPLNKIPTLVLDDGQVMYDSLTICEYFCDLAGGDLFGTGAARWEVLTRHALANSFLDALILYRSEATRAPAQQSAGLLAAFATKTTAMLNHVTPPPPGRADIGDITLAVALAYLDFRFAHIGWREGRPALAEWYAAFSARPSMIATTAVDG